MGYFLLVAPIFAIKSRPNVARATLEQAASQPEQESRSPRSHGPSPIPHTTKPTDLEQHCLACGMDMTHCA
eukprot:scaffold48129_cov88-Phaeocystis_antarctica.AAC.1